MALQDPFAPAVFAVSWAGETSSVNWFHIAREYTERWHHEQQIRDAVRKPGISDSAFYYPVLDTFMQALPYTYRNTEAPADSVVQVTITGDAGGHWFITKKQEWVLSKDNLLPVAAHTSIDGAIAWKLFTKSWRKNDVLSHVTLEGNFPLAEIVLNMISVMG